MPAFLLSRHDEEEHFIEARSIAERLEPGFGVWELERSLYGLGRLSFLRGDYAEARRLFTRALELNSRHADPTNVKLDILLGFSMNNALSISSTSLPTIPPACLKRKRLETLPQAVMNEGLEPADPPTLDELISMIRSS